MDQDKALRLLLRQLKDVQAQADKILTGEDSHETIETFAKYSIELKEYISKNVASFEIKSYLTELPVIKYQRTGIKFWQYMMLVSWWIAIYMDYQAKNRAIEEIGTAKGKYATLEVLVRALVNS
jgi:hypothetical protein